MVDTMNRSILIVDDEADIVELAALYLRDEGFKVSGVSNGPAALEEIERSSPDLVVLDIMLPGMDGWEVCRQVRALHDTPIIMVTARGDAIDRVVGLELGADDYIVKPFHGRELVARVRAVLRRSASFPTPPTAHEEEEPVKIGDVSIDPARRQVFAGNVEVHPRARAFDLLLYMAQHPDIVLTRDRLLERVWGYDFLGDSRTVDVHVAHVRTHIESSETVTIETVWGVGYRLVARHGASTQGANPSAEETHDTDTTVS